MAKHFQRACAVAQCLVFLATILAGFALAQDKGIGREVSIPRHMQDGEEYAVTPRALIDYGRKLFEAMWTSQEGAGRPLSKGTGMPLGNARDPLVFPRNFNRVSGPDTNSC